MDLVAKVLFGNSRERERAKNADDLNRAFKDNLDTVKKSVEKKGSQIRSLMDLIYDSSCPEEQGMDSISDSIFTLLELLTPLFESKVAPEFRTDDVLDKIDEGWYGPSFIASPLLIDLVSRTSSPRRSTASASECPLRGLVVFRRARSASSTFDPLSQHELVSKVNSDKAAPSDSNSVNATLSVSWFPYSASDKYLEGLATQEEEVPGKLHRRESLSLIELLAEDDIPGSSSLDVVQDAKTCSMEGLEHEPATSLVRDANSSSMEDLEHEPVASPSVMDDSPLSICEPGEAEPNDQILKSGLDLLPACAPLKEDLNHDMNPQNGDTSDKNIEDELTRPEIEDSAAAAVQMTPEAEPEDRLLNSESALSPPARKLNNSRCQLQEANESESELFHSDLVDLSASACLEKHHLDGQNSHQAIEDPTLPEVRSPAKELLDGDEIGSSSHDSGLQDVSSPRNEAHNAAEPTPDSDRMDSPSGAGEPQFNSEMDGPDVLDSESKQIPPVAQILDDELHAKPLMEWLGMKIAQFPGNEDDFQASGTRMDSPTGAAQPLLNSEMEKTKPPSNSEAGELAFDENSPLCVWVWGRSDKNVPDEMSRPKAGNFLGKVRRRVCCAKLSTKA